MSHSADFTDAHNRHWEDAELLYGNKRWANAGQLYGFSAECGLKSVMLLLGMKVDDTGRPVEPQHRKHVQDLWPIFVQFATERNGSEYMPLLPNDEPFSDWSHHDRYAHRRRFDKANVDPHREAAQGIRQMVEQAAQDQSHE